MLHYGTSYTERLTKQYIRGKKVESDFEERGQYEANLQEETLVVLEWYEAPVADLCVKPGKSAALLAYTTQRPMSLNMKLCLKLLLRKTCGYFLYSFAMS